MIASKSMSEIIEGRSLGSAPPPASGGNGQSQAKMIALIGSAVVVVAVGAFSAGQGTRLTDEQAKAEIHAAKKNAVISSKASIKAQRVKLRSKMISDGNRAYNEGKSEGARRGEVDGTSQSSQENATATAQGRREGYRVGYQQGMEVFTRSRGF